MTAPRVRIAPSPTGDPHVGTAYVALFNRTWANREGGQFILRIDDTDRTRYQESSETQIFKALQWLGLAWDEGPDIGGPHAPYRQSERQEIYREAVDRLLASGAAYRCFCTPERISALREEQNRRKERLGYDGHCRSIASDEAATRAEAGEPHVIRLRVPEGGVTAFRDELRGTIEVQNAEIDDQILIKTDGYPTYHLANVVDDIAFGITEVVRAEEWLISTPKHVLLYRAFNEALPRFFHVPLLRNADKSKISKRKNPVSLDWFREQGYLPEALLNFLALMGWSTPDEEEVFDRAEFEKHFQLEKISLGAPVFDLEKLDWLNGQHLRRLSPEELYGRLESEGMLPEGCDAEGLAKIFPVVVERLHRLPDVAEKTKWFFGEPEPYEAEALTPPKGELAMVPGILEAVVAKIDGVSDWTLGGLEAALEEVRTELGVKKPQLFMPLRIALTGRKDSPGIFEVMEILGAGRSKARISAAHEIARDAVE